MPLKLSAACGCSIGKQRDNNEDNFYFNGLFLREQNNGLNHILGAKYMIIRKACFSVFDGMGGEDCGESASFAAASSLGTWFSTQNDCKTISAAYFEDLCNAMSAAVRERARELAAGRMGTTMAMLLFTPDMTYVCNIGDSRIYSFRDGRLSQLSEDHITYIPSAPKKAGLTQYLGVHPDELMLEPYICALEPQKGDTFLICSDGLTDMLSDAEISACLMQHVSPRQIVRHLIDTANRNGGRDNITALVVKV